MSRLVIFNKPFGVLCQFRDKDGRPVLADFIDLPGVYPAGRLDHDSEGLLLLTDDGVLQARIADPRFNLPKTYWAQLEGDIDDDALARLAAGVTLNDGPTLPAVARRLAPPALWERVPPVRYRAAIPTSWIELTIREGRNRQVRRMTAAVGFPTLRLVRAAIGPWSLEGLAPGQWREVEVDRATLPLATAAERASGKPAAGAPRSGAGRDGTGPAGSGSRPEGAGGRRPARGEKPREDNRPLRRGGSDGTTPASGEGQRPLRPGRPAPSGSGNGSGRGKGSGKAPERATDKDTGPGAPPRRPAGDRTPRPVRPSRP